jgi:pentatricopeptide repeat protein
VSKGLWQDVNLERGKRQKGKFEDILDDDPEAQAAFANEIRMEADVNRARRAGLPVPDRWTGRSDGPVISGSAAGGAVRALGNRDDGENELEGEDGDKEEEMIDFDALAEDDEELRALMDEIEREERNGGAEVDHHVAEEVEEEEVDVERVGRLKKRGEVTNVNGVKYQRVTVEDIEDFTERLMRNEQRNERDDDEMKAEDYDSGDYDGRYRETATSGGRAPSAYIRGRVGNEKRDASIVSAGMRRAEQHLQMQQMHPRNNRDKDGDDGQDDEISEFSDPFEDLRQKKARRDSLSGRTQRLVDLLDGGGDPGDVPLDGEKDRSKSPKGLLDTAMSEGKGNNDATGAGAMSKDLLSSLLDDDEEGEGVEDDMTGRKVATSKGGRGVSALDDDEEGLISLDTIAEQWEMVEFGRAPEPDYSLPVKERQQGAIERARLAFKEMQLSGIKPDVTTLTSYMSVYSEALQYKEALKIFKSFGAFGVTPTSNSYRAIVKMHIRRKDIDRAVDVKEDMLKAGVLPDSETYGLIVESMAHRNMVVEGLKLLEEATEKRVRIPERHMKFLRARCEKLGIQHPDMPPNPKQWVKDMKQMRRATKHDSERKVEPLRSALYGK